MKEILYPYLKNLFLFRRISFHLILGFCLLAITALNVSAKTVVIGNGSGTVSQISMNGLNAGDVLAIAPGTYSGATFANLTNITIVNNGGLVTFTGAWSLNAVKNLTISGTGASGITYGFAFAGITGDVFPLVGYGIGKFYGLRIYNCEFFNCATAGSLVDCAINGWPYTPGDTTTIMLYKASFQNWKLHNCGGIFAGYAGQPKALLDIQDSVAFGNFIIDSTATNGSEIFGGACYRFHCYNWTVNGTLTGTTVGDVGLIVLYGNASIHNIYRHGGRGYIARMWNTGLNAPSDSYFYNIVDLSHIAYGTIDTRCDNSFFDGIHTFYGNMHINNVTSGNLYSPAYTCPLLILGGQNSGARTYFYNCVQFNATTYLGPSEIPIMNNNSNGTWNTSDSGSNRIYSAAAALSVFADTVTYCYPIKGGELTTAFTASPMVNPDIWGNSGNRIGAASAPGSSVVIANAGSGQTITLPTNFVNLTGSASTVINSTISSYSWTETSGPNSAVFSAPNSVNTNATGLIAGTYVFSIRVKDANNDSSIAKVTIIVSAPQPPVVSAGAAQTITLPTSTVALTGTATDASGTITSYSWTQVSGPGTAAITTASAISTTVTGLVAGTYVFQLKATDNNNLSGTGSVTITVNPVGNQAPVVSAGTAQTITLPTSTVTLTGTATDATGTITSYAWTEVSGPGTATITTASAISTTVTGLVAGTYVFQLKATDNNNLSGIGSVTITVNPVGNQAPVVSAGTAQTITLPVSSVTLTGTATDATGTFTSYTWTQVSGPNAATITTASAISTTVTGLVAGTYVFQLNATDNNNLSGNGTVTITVNPVANQAPVVSAGAAQTITLPTSTVTLTGTATDATGTITSYAWIQVSGPGTAAITTASAISTTVTSLVAGTYVFQLKATDNNNLSGTGVVSVIVNAATSQGPYANAGVNQSITLPTNTVNLDGSGSYDSYGTIVSYSWQKVFGNGGVTITNSNTVKPTVSGLQQGQYIFELTVLDNNGSAGNADVIITVNPASIANQPPVANAGNDTTIALPSTTASLNASASTAPTGNITTYQWSQLSGPNSSDILSPNAVTTNVSGLTAGAYVFQVTVTDNSGVASTDTVTVMVVDNLRTSSGQSITLYPNPTANPLNVQITSQATGTLWIYIYDIRGNIIMEKQYNKPSNYFSIPMNLSLLHGGTYTLRAVIENKTALTAKFVKQ